MSVRAPVAILCLAATAGLVFASVSTLDFVAHLDRQVHDLHCSFVPGVVSTAEGAAGCKVTLMSPYSSVFRTSMWGGIPISLPAMAVFAFLLFRGVDLWGRPPGQQRTAAQVLLAATFVPVIASGVMGYIAMTELEAACKLCIGIYGSSAVALIGGIWAAAAARPDVDEAQPNGAGLMWLVGGAQLGAFVALPTLAYATMTPNFDEYIGSCGKLADVDDPYGILVPLDDHTGGTPVVEVLDPLCPSCKAFEERLDASELPQKLHRKALLFPLDKTCNWMVSASLHPGACAVSEAILCARREGLAPQAVIDWAFAHQEEIIAAEKANPGAAAERVSARFEALAGCLGSAEVQSDLNKSLRWAVSHELPVMTPQLYIAGVKLCDEDTDLGMEWAVTRVLAKQADGSLKKAAPGKTAAPPDRVDSKPDAKADAKRKRPGATNAKPKPEPKAGPKPEPKADPKADPKPEPKANPNPEPKADPDPDPKPEPKADPDPEPKADPKPDKPPKKGKLPSVTDEPEGEP